MKNKLSLGFSDTKKKKIEKNWRVIDPCGDRIGVRAGGARGAAAPPNFGQLRFFWAARENLGKASFQRRFHVFLLV